MKLKTVDFKFLEYLSFWQGRLTGTRLADLLGVERTHAHRAVLAPYMRINPDALAQKGRFWAVRDPDRSLPRYGPARVEDLFRFLDGLEALADLSGEVLGVPLENAAIDLPVEHNLHAFRTLYAGAAQRRVVQLLYRSRKQEIRLRFSPHALIRTAARPHFRGFAVGDGDRPGFFTDLVPSRVITAEDLGGAGYVSGETDPGWTGRVEVRLRLSPALPEMTRDSLMSEYAGLDGFSDGVLRIDGVRICIAPYLCRHLRYRVFDNTPVEVWIPETDHPFGSEGT